MEKEAFASHFLFLDKIWEFQIDFFYTFENIIGNEAFAPQEQMLHFPYCLKKHL